MDLQYAGRTVHLPQEVLNGIVSCLHKAADIAAIRLVNRAFCTAATELMLNIQQTPSELFTRPTIAEIEEVERAKPFEEYLPRRIQDPFTSWTWIQVPPDVTLEDRRTEVGRSFLQRVLAPASEKYWSCIDRDPDDDEELKGPRALLRRDELPVVSGRKATCWSRVREDPSLFCIVMQWHSRLYWNAYRMSNEASPLQAFLEDVAPGCAASSAGEAVILPPQLRRRHPLFNAECEIRTVFFKPDMTAEDKVRFEATLHVNYSCMRLPGLKKVNGKNAVGVRIIIPQNCYMMGMTKRQKTEAKVLAEDLRFDASESMHSIFHFGPWRN